MRGGAPAHRLKVMHDQGRPASGPGGILPGGAVAGGRGGTWPVMGWSRIAVRTAAAARSEAIYHVQLKLKGPADPRVSLLVDTPGCSGGLFERAMVDGLDYLFVLRRRRLLGRRPRFDDFAGAQNQSQRQDQSRCRQSAVSASSQAYGSHFPSPVLTRRARPGDVHYSSNFRARKLKKCLLFVFWTRLRGKWLHGGLSRDRLNTCESDETPPWRAEHRGTTRHGPNETPRGQDPRGTMALSSASDGLCRVRA